MRTQATVIHMKTSMRTPSSARIFKSAPLLAKTVLKMVNMAVAKTQETVVKRKVRKVKRSRGR